MKKAEKTQGAEKKEGREAGRAKVRKTRERKGNKKKIGFAIFGIGVVALIIGITAMVINLTTGPGVRDAEYLVTKGTFVREGENGVYWRFDEVGRGSLTTDDFENVYNFIWSIKDGKLLMETDWLYTLNDEFSYKVDQEAGTLTLIRGEDDNEIVLRAADEEAGKNYENML